MQQPQLVQYVLFFPGCMAWWVWTCAHKSLLRAPGPALSDSEFPLPGFLNPPFSQSHCRGDRRRKHWTARCHCKSGVEHLHTYLTALARPMHALRGTAFIREALTARLVYSYLSHDLFGPQNTGLPGHSSSFPSFLLPFPPITRIRLRDSCQYGA